MCFNEHISWITFVGGQTLNMLSFILLYKYNNKDLAPRIIIIGHCYPLFMQLAEAMVWRNDSSAVWGQVAYILNVTQAHIVTITSAYLLYRQCAWSNNQWVRHIRKCSFVLAAFLCLIYTSLTIINNHKCDYEMIFSDCYQLVLSWWHDGNCMSSPTTLVLYWLTCSLAIISLPLPWSILGIILYVGTLLASIELYPCGQGSMWCWMVGGWGTLTMITAFVLKFYTKYDVEPVDLLQDRGKGKGKRKGKGKGKRKRKRKDRARERERERDEEGTKSSEIEIIAVSSKSEK